VLDFSKNKLTYNNIEVAKQVATSQSSAGASCEPASGPNFRHVYNKLLGPTFPGEYIAPESDDETGCGLYVLSYPGIAFSFPVQHSAWQSGRDFVSLLSSSATLPAASMAIFDGDSWTDARQHLYSQTLHDPRIFHPPQAKTKDTYPDEISLLQIYGGGKLEMVRPWGSSSFWLTLGATTPQDLVAELGPPDAIYRKNDQRMLIHNAKQRSGNSRPGTARRNSRYTEDSTDTDHSSPPHTTTSDASDDDSNDKDSSRRTSKEECFYNYFYHGFDILLSSPSTTPSPAPPSQNQDMDNNTIVPMPSSAPLVATKIILHSNVPGSYSFNRHRRCQWEIAYLSSSSSPAAAEQPITSESHFSAISAALHEEWKSVYSNGEDARQRQRGMVLNRGWGEDPGSSIELLGGWEDGVGERTGKGGEGGGGNGGEEKGLGNTVLYGFPGLVFEVLKNGVVSGVTVF
jgi:hypothetical protein